MLVWEVKCDACGDPAEKDRGKILRHNDRPMCKDCYDELARGVIRNQNISFIGGISARGEEEWD